MCACVCVGVGGGGGGGGGERMSHNHTMLKNDIWDTFSIWYMDVIINKFKNYLSFSLFQLYDRGLIKDD